MVHMACFLNLLDAILKDNYDNVIFCLSMQLKWSYVILIINSTCFVPLQKQSYMETDWQTCAEYIDNR